MLVEINCSHKRVAWVRAYHVKEVHVARKIHKIPGESRLDESWMVAIYVAGRPEETPITRDFDSHEEAYTFAATLVEKVHNAMKERERCHTTN